MTLKARPNTDVRIAIATAGLKQWEVAETVGIREDVFSKMMARKEMDKETKTRILDAIAVIIAERNSRANTN